MIRLEKVKLEDKELLWNINQKYLYEMTNYYDDPMDSNGNYHYGYFDLYFTDTNRKAFFIYNDDMLVGFVFINPYSYIDASPDYVMAEFTIFPTYRKKHFATEAVKLIFDTFPGKWEIKYNENNKIAKHMWLSLTSIYNPKIYHLNEQETVLCFNTI